MTSAADSSSPVTASSPAPEQAIAVARNIDLFGAQGGAPIAHIDLADVLALDEMPVVRMSTTHRAIDAHSIRLRTAAGVVTGYVDRGVEGERKHERGGEGIGFFVGSDTPVRAVDGSSSLATLHRGAFVQLRGRQGADAIVGLAPFAVDGRVPMAALTVQAPPPPAQPSTIAHVVERRQLLVKMSNVQVSTECDTPISLLGETTAGLRVSQTVAGIEVIGLVTDGGSACPSRVIARAIDPSGHQEEAAPPLPPSFVSVAPSTISLLTKARALYKITRDETTGATRCQEWTFEQVEKQRRMTATYRYQSPLGETLTSRTTYALEPDGGGSLNLAPNDVELEVVASSVLDSKGHKPEGYGEGWSGDEWILSVMGENQDGLVTLESCHSATEVLAYHPDDAEIWYRDKPTCEAHIAKERAASSPLAPITARVRASRPGTKGC